MVERDMSPTDMPLDSVHAVQIRVLGGISATVGGVEVDLGGRLQRAVLAILIAARGKAVSPNRLVELVWDENAPANPVAALQSYVSHLRRRLEPGAARGRHAIIRSEPAGYRAQLPTEAVDAWHFEAIVNAAANNTDLVAAASALREALGLWRGRAFADYAGHGWADAEAARCDELHALAEDRLFAARLETERLGLLIPDLEAAVAGDPLREERWRLLALALYRDSRQADALAAIRRAKQTLADELGVDAGPALRDLETRILEHAPDLMPASGLAPEPSRPVAASLPPPDDLVDRDSELARIDCILADSTQAHGSVLLFEGPAGIGKTRLLIETRNRAEAQQAIVLTARGSQLEQQFAFGAVRQLFEPLLRDQRDADLLAGAAEAARAVFDNSPNSAVSLGDGVFNALHGLYWLTANTAGRRPLVLCVDDLQWCDTGSLRFFAYLARRLEGMPVVLATTLRTGEDYEEAALIAEVHNDPATVVMRPGPLSLEGVGDLVRNRLGADADQRFIAACHRTTSGNPLLLRQVLRALEADKIRPDASHADTVTAIGSRAIASLVLMRLARLPTQAATVARAIAILGDKSELPTVAQLCELSEQETASAVADLVRTELIRDEYPLSFVHPLIRDAIYNDVPAGLRQLHHDRAARALHAVKAPVEKVAAHLLQVPVRGDQWVVDVLRKAGGIAADRGAPEGAASYLKRALAEPPPDDQRTTMLLQLGAVESLRDGYSAARHLREAYNRMPNGAERAAVAQALAQVLVFAGDRGDAARFAHDAALATDLSLTDARQGLVGLERIAGYMHGLDPALWETAVAELDGEGPGSRRLAAALSWETAVRSGSRERAVELAEFALRDGLLQEHDTGLLWVVAAVVLDMADVDLGTFWSDCWARALAQGSLFSILAVHLWWGNQSWRAGDLREAEALLNVANEQSREWGSNVGIPYCDSYVIHTMIARGHLDRARLYVEVTRPRERIGDGARLCKQAETRLLIAEGRYAEALALTDELADVMSYVTNPIHRHWHRHRAGALAGLGRRDEALEHARESVRRAREWGAPRQVGLQLGKLGVVEGAAGEDTLREAIAVLTPTKGRVELARAQYHLAGLLGPSAEARALLHQSFDLADACAADGLRRDVEQRLEQWGEPARESTRPHLTSLEKRIARMAVEGADDREIAQSLFLTRRAVEVALADIRHRIGSDRHGDLESVLTA
jgi:DNA-binding SARP family transcriptional activator/DNA-binding CsgD family transcriptional regulator